MENMMRFTAPWLLLLASLVAGCDAPRSLSTAQMTPALMPIAPIATSDPSDTADPDHLSAIRSEPRFPER